MTKVFLETCLKRVHTHQSILICMPTMMLPDTKLAIITLFQLFLRFLELKGHGNLKCRCQLGQGSPVYHVRVPRFSLHGVETHCETICRGYSASRICSSGNCEKEVSKSNIKAITNACQDKTTGKFHKAGQSWRQRCKIYTCEKDLNITRRAVGCTATCVIGSNSRNRCCPVCKSKLSCSPKEISMEIPLPLLRGTKPSRLSLSDPRCRPSVNSTHVIFKTDLTSCGTSLRRTKHGFLYSNFVQKQFSMNMFIIRPWRRFSCFFHHKISSSELLETPSFKVTITAAQQQRNLAMHYTDELGRIKPGQTKLKFVKGNPVYVLIKGQDIPFDTHFVAVESCSVISPRTTHERQLIFKGCSVDASLRVRIKTFDRLWFSFKATKLPTRRSSTYLDLTCQAAICSNRANSAVCNRKC